MSSPRPRPENSTGRRVGVVLLLAAVVAVLVESKIQHPDQLDGFAGPDASGLPPTVGQCLLEAPPQVFSRTSGLLPPPLAIGDCSDPHYGEVAAVIRPDNLAVEVSPCFGADGVDVEAYLGYPPPAPDSWVPLLYYTVVDAGPDQRQVAAGQQWIACIIAPINFDSDPAAVAPSFMGTLKDSYLTGTMPEGLAACADASVRTSSTAVPCDQPHQVQYFAQSYLGGPGPDLAEITATCESYLVEQTGIADLGPITGLDTVIWLYPTDGDSITEPVLPLQPGQTAAALCTVATEKGRTLNASLIGLGADPIPWSP